jgi:hypothetical protein
MTCSLNAAPTLPGSAVYFTIRRVDEPPRRISSVTQSTTIFSHPQQKIMDHRNPRPLSLIDNGEEAVR